LLLNSRGHHEQNSQSLVFYPTSMSKEFAFQINMFTSDLVDNRSAKQIKQAHARSQPQQIEMFSQREMAQFGVEAHPKLPLSPNTKLELIMEDPRTEEEKERDLRCQIEQHTYPLPIWEAEATQEFDPSSDKDSQLRPENEVQGENGVDNA
jgi:hypothetical protein